MTQTNPHRPAVTDTQRQSRDLLKFIYRFAPFAMGHEIQVSWFYINGRLVGCLKHSVVLCIAARYGANIRRAQSESYRWDITMLLEEL